MARAPLAALVVAALAALIACTPPPVTAYRDRSVPISSTTRFDPDRFAGRWQRTAAFDPAFLSSDCRTVTFTKASDIMAVAPCDGPESVAHDISPLGRLTPREGPDLWVLWVDEGFRTAVIGTPSGALGWVLERSGRTPPDRRAAARQVLDFNGYDLKRLIEG
ncbi:MAG: lipocalin family protein [Pseudomonadota bacterium]